MAASHWFGCIWALQTTLVSDSVLDSWLGDKGYCVPLPPIEEEIGAASAGGGYVCPEGYACRDEEGVGCLPHGTIYAASTCELRASARISSTPPETPPRLPDGRCPVCSAHLFDATLPLTLLTSRLDRLGRHDHY